MKTTIRIDGKRNTIDIPEKDKLDAYRLVQKLGFKSLNGLITYALLRYEDDFEFIQDYPTFVRYSLKRLIKENAQM